MLIPIEINTSDLLSQFSMTKEEVEETLDYTIKEIAASFAVKWEETAMMELHSTRQRYVENLFVIDEGRLTGTIVLDYSKDSLIQMIEEGASPFDMKTYFEKSDKVKYNKSGGWYLTIPYKFGAPDTIGDSLGMVTNLPSSVHAVLKKKEVDPSTGRSSGLTMKEIPSGYEIPKTRAAIDIPKSQRFEAYTHKSSIYKGAFKSVDKTTGQSSYGSFRRAGENSDIRSWIHPGLPELNLAQKAMDKFEQTIDIELTQAIDNALLALGFE